MCEPALISSAVSSFAGDHNNTFALVPSPSSSPMPVPTRPHSRSFDSACLSSMNRRLYCKCSLLLRSVLFGLVLCRRRLMRTEESIGACPMEKGYSYSGRKLGQIHIKLWARARSRSIQSSDGRQATATDEPQQQQRQRPKLAARATQQSHSDK